VAGEIGMPDKALKIGWIGMGRMGFPMAERLLKAGYDVAIWNRTRAKAEPLAASGGRIVDRPADLAHVDVLFSIVSTGADLDEVYFGPNGVASANAMPGICVDCSTIAVEESTAIRERLWERSASFICCPVSGNAKVIKAGKLSAVASGPEAAFRTVEPMVTVFAPRGVSYVGEGELARICKIAHNVMLGVVIENLIEITLLTNKLGVPRHAFLAFLNNGVMGSMFTAYKSPALVNLDWATTFTPELLRKDLDLGLALARENDVPMPVTAATREMLQGHFGVAKLQADPEAYLAQDFAALMETMALAAGMKLTSEEQAVPSGL
jgi:3-hydroxyisobutyrate dehydrogenase